MNKKKYELPGMDGFSFRTITNNKKEKDRPLKPKQTLDSTRTFFNQERNPSRKRDERSPYERSPYLEYQPVKKITFYNDKSRKEPNYYIIKQGKTINFKDYFDEPRAKSSGRTQPIPYKKDRQRQLSFMAYGGTLNQKLYQQNTSAQINPKDKEVTSSDRSAEHSMRDKQGKKNFRRKCFIESNGTSAEQTGIQDQVEMCLDEISNEDYRWTRMPQDTTFSRIKHISQETDKSLVGSVTNYFNVSKHSQKINSDFIKNTSMKVKGEREEVFVLESRKIPQFNFTIGPTKRRKDDERNPIEEPDSQDDF